MRLRSGAITFSSAVTGLCDSRCRSSTILAKVRIDVEIITTELEEQQSNATSFWTTLTLVITISLICLVVPKYMILFRSLRDSTHSSCLEKMFKKISIKITISPNIFTTMMSYLINILVFIAEEIY